MRDSSSLTVEERTLKKNKKQPLFEKGPLLLFIFGLMRHFLWRSADDLAPGLPPSIVALQKHSKAKRPQHHKVTWFWKTELLLRSAASFMQVDSLRKQSLSSGVFIQTQSMTVCKQCDPRASFAFPCLLYIFSEKWPGLKWHIFNLKSIKCPTMDANWWKRSCDVTHLK